MKETANNGKSLIGVEITKRIFTSLLILAACGATAAADQVNSSLMIHNNQQYIVKSETIRIVTAYNAGDPNQTDDTPCISANGENLCVALAKGQKRCAANFVPLNSRLYVDKIGVCLVTDRTNKRYRNRVDIAMQKSEYHKALPFGRQKLHVKIVQPIAYEKCTDSNLYNLPVENSTGLIEGIDFRKVAGIATEF